MSEHVARDVTVRGTVQGVSFREETRGQAERAGVVGWVRNAEDGSVRAHLEGERDAIGDVVSWMRQGPSGAEVEAVDEEQGEVRGHESFEVR